MTTCIFGTDIPDNAIIEGTWEVFLPPPFNSWMPLHSATPYYNPQLIGTTWGSYSRSVTSLFPGNGFATRWRIPNHLQVSVQGAKTPSIRWTCGHKRLSIDNQCPICKAFGRASVTE